MRLLYLAPHNQLGFHAVTACLCHLRGRLFFVAVGTVACNQQVHPSGFDGRTVFVYGCNQPVKFPTVAAPGCEKHIFMRHEPEAVSGRIRLFLSGKRYYRNSEQH